MGSHMGPLGLWSFGNHDRRLEERFPDSDGLDSLKVVETLESSTWRVYLEVVHILILALLLTRYLYVMLHQWAHLRWRWKAWRIERMKVWAWGTLGIIFEMLAVFLAVHAGLGWKFYYLLDGTARASIGMIVFHVFESLQVARKESVRLYAVVHKRKLIWLLWIWYIGFLSLVLFAVDSPNYVAVLEAIRLIGIGMFHVLTCNSLNHHVTSLLNRFMAQQLWDVNHEMSSPMSGEQNLNQVVPVKDEPVVVPNGFTKVRLKSSGSHRRLSLSLRRSSSSTSTSSVSMRSASMRSLQTKGRFASFLRRYRFTKIVILCEALVNFTFAAWLIAFHSSSPSSINAMLPMLIIRLVFLQLGIFTGLIVFRRPRSRRRRNHRGKQQRSPMTSWEVPKETQA